MRGRAARRGVAGAAYLLAGCLAAAGCSLDSLDSADPQPSVGRTAKQPDEYARVLRLDGGRAGHVAVSRGDAVTVWWRAPGESTWTDAQVVGAGAGRYLTDTRVRVAGTTVAIRASYDTKPPWEDEEESTESTAGIASSVFVACRAGSCVTSRHYEQVQEPECRRGSCRHSRPESHGVSQVPELTADGTAVLFGATERGYVVWDAAAGLRELEPRGLPDEGRVSTPLLAADGSLRVAVGEHRGGSCALSVWTADPTDGRAVEFRRAASTRTPTSTGDCASTLEAFTPDQLLVHTDRFEPTYFVEVDGAWRRTDEDPTGMLRLRPQPGRRAAGSVVRTGYWHWREVVTASPDGRRLLAQVHEPGDPAWSEPVTVATAPAGVDCFEIAPTSTPSQEPFYVSMRCRYSEDGRRRYVGVHAVTGDGLTWQSAIGDDLPTRVGGENLFFGGSPAYRWSPEGGLEEVGLPIPANSRSFELDDGSFVLVTARPVGDRCRLVARVARPGVTAWSEPLSNLDPWMPAGEPCEPVGQYDGDHVTVYFPSGPEYVIRPEP